MRVALICQLILQTIEGKTPKRYVISVDEKTGIQALERLVQTAPVSKKGLQRREFEYKRHGTITLMAALNVADGQIINHYLNKTRTEADYLTFIQQTAQPLIDSDPQTQVVFLADQLNTHLSESLVKWVAQVEGLDLDLGKKGHKGILHNQKTRLAFLENQKHRIRFVFTPKHCSWLNPVENWFAKLQRHILENGNFNSVNELADAIERYIIFYNICLKKPLKWTFKGFIKAQKLLNFKPSNN